MEVTHISYVCSIQEPLVFVEGTENSRRLLKLITAIDPSIRLRFKDVKDILQIMEDLLKPSSLNDNPLDAFAFLVDGKTKENLKDRIKKWKNANLSVEKLKKRVYILDAFDFESVLLATQLNIKKNRQTSLISYTFKQHDNAKSIQGNYQEYVHAKIREIFTEKTVDQITEFDNSKSSNPIDKIHAYRGRSATNNIGMATVLFNQKLHSPDLSDLDALFDHLLTAMQYNYYINPILDDIISFLKNIALYNI